MKVTEYLSPNPLAPWIIRHFPMMSMNSSSSAIFCPSVVTKEVGEVICRQTKGQFLARRTMVSYPSPYNGRFYSGSLRCSGEESHLSECEEHMLLVDHCLEGYGMLDCSTGIIIQLCRYFFPLPFHFVDSQSYNIIFLGLSLFAVAPDLVPDVEQLRRSLVSRYYVEVLPLYYLQCAHEEQCLSSSADTVPETSNRQEFNNL